MLVILNLEVNKIEALKQLKEAIPISDLHSRNKVDGLLQLRKDLGLMSDEECSEWEKMVLVEEGFPQDKSLHQRYLYTGITRASKKLVIIKK